MTYRFLAALGLTLALVGCKEDPPEPPTDTTTPSETGDTTPPDETGTTAATAETGTEGITGDTAPTTIAVDCTAVPASPVSFAPIAGGRAYHDVLFDYDGNVIGSDGNNLVKADYYGNASVMLPGTGTVQGLHRLLDGEFVGATDTTQALFRFSSAGGQSVIVGNSGAYGVIVGHDGLVYTANYDAVERIDPVTGDRTELYSRPGFLPRVINYNVDWTKLYMGTEFGNGDIYAFDTDPVTLDPIGAPYVFATGVGSGDYHDCLAVDICDNVYVCDFVTSKMYKITPAGAVSIYIDFPPGTYAHGAEWGSGINGFRLDALYVSQPYNGNTVAEVVVGVPGRDWDGTGWP